MADERRDDQARPASQMSRSELIRRGGLAAAAAVFAGSGASLARGAGFAATASTASRGGRLRVGIEGAGAQSQLNPLIDVGEYDFAQAQAMFERLTDFDAQGRLYNSLAEEFSHDSAGRVWKIKLKPGVTWHDGSPFTADDVVYTLKYQLDPSNKTDGNSNLSGFLKPSGVRKSDSHTVELHLTTPYAQFPAILGSKEMFVIKNGTTSFDHPVGTGPFMFKSWSRGEQTLMVRNPHYHQHGLPYLDELQLIEIDDPNARMNALTGGQIDALARLDPKLVGEVKSSHSLRLLQDRSSATTDQFMRMNESAFIDPRVRQAFRLMIDRHQLVQNALLGYGTIGNDLHCLTDPDYARELPQRQHDPEQAASLLKKAGRSSLSVQLYTADAAPGMLASATLIAEQAKKAGVTINLQVVPAADYYSGPNFKKTPFESSDWGQHTLDSQISQAYTCGATWNEPGWCNSKFNRLVADSRKTFDPGKRREYLFEAQKLLWEEGGYIIWGFRDLLDATTSKVHGVQPSTQRNLGYYHFENAYLA